LVGVETCPPSRRTPLTSEEENATVVLGSVRS
jgi:hypothetical protein